MVVGGVYRVVLYVVLRQLSLVSLRVVAVHATRRGTACVPYSACLAAVVVSLATWRTAAIATELSTSMCVMCALTRLSFTQVSRCLHVHDCVKVV